MDIFTAIDTRVSAITLTAPAPSREQVVRIINAGARAPDHGKLAPWRFVVIEGAARNVLGQSMVAALLAHEPEATVEQQARERDKALRAPCIIAVAAHTLKQYKVPEIEQILAAGAAAQNMFLAAHALGYGVMWKTGTAAYDVTVKATLGLQADDHIVAFLYLGTVSIAGAARLPVVDDRVHWLAN